MNNFIMSFTRRSSCIFISLRNRFLHSFQILNICTCIIKGLSVYDMSYISVLHYFQNIKSIFSSFLNTKTKTKQNIFKSFKKDDTHFSDKKDDTLFVNVLLKFKYNKIWHWNSTQLLKKSDFFTISLQNLLLSWDTLRHLLVSEIQCKIVTIIISC